MVHSYPCIIEITIVHYSNTGSVLFYYQKRIDMETIKNILKDKKTPLTLLMLEQSYQIFLSLSGLKSHEYIQYVTVFIALIVAASLDSVIVSTAFNAPSRWKTVTLAISTITGILFVLDLYYNLHWYWLRISFPLLVFSYAMYLSDIEKNKKIEVKPKTDPKPEPKVIKPKPRTKPRTKQRRNSKKV